VTAVKIATFLASPWRLRKKESGYRMFSGTRNRECWLMKRILTIMKVMGDFGHWNNVNYMGDIDYVGDDIHVGSANDNDGEGVSDIDSFYFMSV
jgi:hypothetical protein